MASLRFFATMFIHAGTPRLYRSVLKRRNVGPDSMRLALAGDVQVESFVNHSKKHQEN